VRRAPDRRLADALHGSVFLTADAHTNVESIGAADSTDLHVWSKSPSPALRADPRWYETLADGTWPEEAWRDPWVFFEDGLWHMLITSRARHTGAPADSRDLGVVGHATSRDLTSWTIGEPLSSPGAGFAHLEVLQTLDFEGRQFVLFSCDRTHLAGDRTNDRAGGVWVAPRDPETGWCSIEEARLLHDESLYAARAVRDREGRLSLIGFVNSSSSEGFGGRISDPITLVPDPDGWPSIASQQVLRRTTGADSIRR
jgi:beta-fructofuranosidase